MVQSLPVPDLPSESGKIDPVKLRADAQVLRAQCDLMEAAGHTSVPVATTALRKLAALADHIAARGAISDE